MSRISQLRRPIGILVAIILALALPGGNRQNINRSDVPHQVQDLINYINGHQK